MALGILVDMAQSPNDNEISENQQAEAIAAMADLHCGLTGTGDPFWTTDWDDNDDQ